jgi:hypothetical protein
MCYIPPPPCGVLLLAHVRREAVAAHVPAACVAEHLHLQLFHLSSLGGASRGGANSAVGGGGA